MAEPGNPNSPSGVGGRARRFRTNYAGRFFRDRREAGKFRPLLTSSAHLHVVDGKTWIIRWLVVLDSENDHGEVFFKAIPKRPAFGPTRDVGQELRLSIDHRI